MMRADTAAKSAATMPAAARTHDLPVRTVVSRLIWLCMGPLVLLAIASAGRHVHEVHAQQDRVESDFLANMSHEIRTPLNAIIGLTQLLSREVHDVRTLGRLGKIADAADHLLQVISDILDLSKIEAGQFELE